jgi:hypothetical protein
MIIEKSQYEMLEDQLSEWEEAAMEQGGIVKSVSRIFKDLIAVLKKSDKLGLDEISVILIFLLSSINNGQEYVQEMCDILSDAYDMDCKEGPGPGETAMINPDGSYVTLKELGIE